tara:strand:- start:200 stop:436 length:237 start_codon:yes stop_codon:yes gene_type:complete
MSIVKPKALQELACISKTKNNSYTPCTSGAFGEQFEFDFGPEFSTSASELCRATNSTLNQPSSTCVQGGFIDIKEDTE